MVNSVICESWPPVCTHRPSRCPVSDASEVVMEVVMERESLGLVLVLDAAYVEPTLGDVR